jgi:polysaccharide export outer membrane protein
MYSALLFITATALAASAGQNPQAFERPSAPTDRAENRRPHDAASKNYILGPQDILQIHVLDDDQVGAGPYPIDLRGNIALPRIGRVHASGLTIDELETQVTDRLKEYLQNPAVTISVTEFRSQPVSILGEVGSPGVHQIRGDKTLFEAISEAGGLKPEAGNTIKVTREKQYGALPLPGVTTDPSGDFSVGEVSIHSLMEAQNPHDNIRIQPHDVITVPKAELVYVIGAVNRSGGFVLSEKSDMSILEALSLAEGLKQTAGPGNAKILRKVGDAPSRTEIPVDLKKIMNGKGADRPLVANDILFVPSSAAKTASLRAIEAIVQTGSGIAVYGRY